MTAPLFDILDTVNLVQNSVQVHGYTPFGQARQALRELVGRYQTQNLDSIDDAVVTPAARLEILSLLHVVATYLPMFEGRDLMELLYEEEVASLNHANFLARMMTNGRSDPQVIHRAMRIMPGDVFESWYKDNCTGQPSQPETLVAPRFDMDNEEHLVEALKVLNRISTDGSQYLIEMAEQTDERPNGPRLLHSS